MTASAAAGHNGHAHSQSPLALLTLGAIGVVFGDIGTSPLYAFKEAFGGAHALALTEAHVLGVLSMIFWAVTLIVSFKYVLFVLNFDNKGEGGVLALLAYATRLMRNKPELQWWVAVAAVFAASGFYGDAVITPAISVLSAVEGLSVAAPALESWIVPLTIAIIVVLFAIQHRGTGKVGRYFGPRVFRWENSRIFNKKALDYTREFYKQHGGKTIIIARFVPLVRTFAPFVAGIGRMPYGRYIAFSIFGALLWVLSLVYLGYFFGNLPIVKDNLSLVIVIIILLSISPAIIELARAKLAASSNALKAPLNSAPTNTTQAAPCS